MASIVCVAILSRPILVFLSSVPCRWLQPSFLSCFVKNAVFLKKVVRRFGRFKNFSVFCIST